MNRRIFLILILSAFAAVPCAGKEWAKKMFGGTVEHDFGTVARGGKAEFDFVLQNLYKEDVHIASVRSSCGCTTPVIINDSLKTWEKGIIRAKFNSRTHIGKKKATITVVIDRPYPAEVQLTVAGYIRSDVVLSPGSVDVGEVDAGTPVAKLLDIKYAGRKDWKIIGVESPDDVSVRIRETRRELMANGQGRIAYKMQVKLSGDMPSGSLMDQIFLVTNDKRLKKIPVTVQGNILSSVTVSPETLALGSLKPGETVTKKLIVQSKRPFSVTDVSCDGDCLSFESPEGAKKVHMIPVTITAGEEAGTLAMKINIATDLGKGAVAKCTATASIRKPRG